MLLVKTTRYLAPLSAAGVVTDRVVEVAPALIVRLLGCVVMLGAKSTVSLAALLVAEPMLLVKTTRYRSPLSAAEAVNERVVEVAPAISLKWAPPSVLTCHCTVADGLAL